MIFNLLIVDDEAPIRKGLSEYIKWEDYDCKVVATANNGEDAITKINENDIKEINDYSKYRYFDLVVGIFSTLLAIAFVGVAIFFFASKFN